MLKRDWVHKNTSVQLSTVVNRFLKKDLQN